jgi:autotransporter translocation and assembly factor TamB
MPDEPSSEATPPAPVRKRRWGRRIGLTILGLLLIVVIFHRPIIFGIARFAFVKVAARQNIDLQVRLGGTIWTNLTIENLRAVPTGKGSSPVEKIAIDRIHAEYSIPQLIRKGIGEFLDSYEIKNAELIINAKAGSKQQKQQLGRDLNNLLQQPAFYSDRVRVENFNIEVRAADAVTQVRGFHLLLDPERTGHLRVARLQIPKVRTWENLEATTEYAARNFYLRDLRLDDQMRIVEFNFDASQRADNKGSIQLRGEFFGGTVEWSLIGDRLQKPGKKMAKSFKTELMVNVRDLSLADAAAHFHVPPPPAARLAELSLRVSGEPEIPQTWQGSASVRTEEWTGIESIALTAQLDNGIARIEPIQITTGLNRITGQATARLPPTVYGFEDTDAEGTLEIHAPMIGAFTARMKPPIEAGVQGNVKFALKQRVLSADVDLHATEIQVGTHTIGSADLRGNFSKSLAVKSRFPLDGASSEFALSAKQIQLGPTSIDSLDVTAGNQNELVTFHDGSVVRGSNSLTFSGTTRVPRTKEEQRAFSIEGRWTLHGPALEEFGLGANGEALAGQVEGAGEIRYTASGYDGTIGLEGHGFRYGEFTAEHLHVDIAIANSIAEVREVTLRLDEENRARLVGKVSLKDSRDYEGTIEARFSNLAKFNPLLISAGSRERLAGSLAIDWKGNGSLAAAQHSGATTVALNKAAFGPFNQIEAAIEGTYSPERIDIPKFQVDTDKGAISTRVQLENRQLTLHDLLFSQDGNKRLSGNASLPLDLTQTKNRDLMFPRDQPLDINLASTEIDLEKLLAGRDKPSPLLGSVSAKLSASGTINNPRANLSFAGRNLQSAAVKKLAGATLDGRVDLANDRVVLDAKLAQPNIQPLSINAQLPLVLSDLLATGKVPMETPIQASVILPRSSINFISSFVPAIRYIEGSASVAVRAEGTIAQPKLSGGAEFDLPAIRLREERMPPVAGVKGNLTFSENRLNFNKLTGDIGGGAFNIGGNIQFAKLTEPVFDLRLSTNELLVVRNDTLTIRIDSDLKLGGPLAAATVAGTVAITNSRFFREIDILPIELPGRPAPKPRASQPNVTFPKPPLRDWKFDVAIKSKDPLLIRGNLANGAVYADLKFGGTGLEPWLEGNATIENFVATLPFSRLTVSRGLVYFTRDDPFNPKLDIQAASELREHNISVYIYGSANDPQTVFSSEPPLPQEDIISLLATGTTTTELASNPDVIAGRAAVLVFQKYYRKIFKRGEPSEQESFLDRFNLDVGGVDSRTGQQEVSAQFKLGEQFYLIGDLGVEGNVSTRLQYLIRFK